MGPIDLAALDEITAAVESGAGLPTVVRAAARALDASVVVLDRGGQALAARGVEAIAAEPVMRVAAGARSGGACG